MRWRLLDHREETSEQVRKTECIEGIECGSGDCRRDGFAARFIARGQRSAIEKGAELKLLRWKRYVQGDEDLWMANTAKFTERAGVKVTVESIVGEELRAKGAMVASVGAGPDVVVGSPEMPHQYADKCVDLTEVAGYLGKKYGGWYDVCQRSCIIDGRWIALSIAVVSFCVVYRQSMVKTAGFNEIPRSLDGFLKLCQTLKAGWISTWVVAWLM